MGFFSDFVGGLGDSIGGLLGAGAGAAIGGLPGAIVGGGLGLLTGGESSAQQYKNSERLLASQVGYSERAMRNKYQWMVSDLRRAGLNPILAAKGGLQGGAVTYSAPTAGYPGVPDWTSSARNLQSAQTERQRTELTYEQIAVERKRNGLVEAQEEQAMAKRDESMENVKKIQREIELIQRKRDFTQQDTERVKQLSLQLRAQVIKIIAESEKLIKIAEVYKGPLGKQIAYFKELVGKLNLFLGANVTLPFGKGGKR